MEIPFDILDNIFGFLISDPESLVSCSEAHPVFSQMAEKYRFYHIFIFLGKSWHNDRPQYLQPSYLATLLSNKPRIAIYVRVVQVEFNSDSDMAPYLEQIAAILPVFPVLECLVFSPLDDRIKVSWESDLPQSFREAVEGCLRLPTLQEVHVGCSDFPLSMLDNHANINYFSFSGTPKTSEFADTTHPRLKSLSVESFSHQRDSDARRIIGSWAIHRIAELQSLKYDYSSDGIILELLERCSNTLNHLDLTLSAPFGSEFATPYDIRYSRQASETTRFTARKYTPISIDFFPLPHLQHLTIRAGIYVFYGSRNNHYDYCISFLPAAMEVLKTASSLRNLTIEITVGFSSASYFEDGPTIDDVEFSPLTALAQSPGSFHHIDLYFNIEPCCTRTQIVALLAKHGCLTELIEQGVLVVHLGLAPTFFETSSKRTIVRSRRSIPEDRRLSNRITPGKFEWC